MTADTDLGKQSITPREILIVTGDPIGKKLAGPAIRATSFASELSRDGHSVRVVSTQDATLTTEAFEVRSVSTAEDMRHHASWAQIIIVQGDALLRFPELTKTLKYLVIDMYDPLHLEQLEQSINLDPKKWNQSILAANALLNHQLFLGDFFLAASTRQLYFWLGALASLGRVNSSTYIQDSTLRSLIDVVPFGLNDVFPEASTRVLRGIVPGVHSNSKILVWAGGVYNWFDPETLVKAIKIVSINHPEIKLFFMGTKHPHPGVPEMEVLTRTQALSKSLDLDGKHVFFNDSWVDFSNRHNYLLEADAGVSTHYEHIETVFSFRTRILDYLWANIPIITTRGDSFAELVETRGIGRAVPEKDEHALAEAIVEVLFDETQSQLMRENMKSVRELFFWSNATEPLRKFCANPHYALDRIETTSSGSIRRKPIRSLRSLFLNFLRRAKTYLIKRPMQRFFR